MKHFPFLLLFAAFSVSLRAANEEEVTFSRNVAPILYEHCAECHRPGQIGPFPLLSFKDAARRSRQIRDITASRQMPPWHAEPGLFAFKDERRLSEEEIETIEKWVAAGSPEGDPEDLPATPTHTDGWVHGVPDLIIELAEVEIPADGNDVFIDFVAEIPVESRQWISCVELLPGNPSVVHHANIKIDRSGGLSEWRGEPQVLEGVMTPVRSKEPLDPFLGWVPGTSPHYLPEGYGIPVDPGANILLQFHYHPTGKPEKDKTQIGIYFSENASHEAFPMLFGVLSEKSPDAHKLDIPAGESHHEVRISKTLPLEGRVHTVQAHGHFLMKDLDLFARLPDGESTLLLSIRNWDFNWQERYAFEEPPLLPKGTLIEAVAIFDNSADNPQNPSDPPKQVRAGPESTDEMCGVALIVIPEDPDFLKISEEGIAYPKIATRLQRFDKDGDGRFSQEEFDALPQRIRILVLENARNSGAAVPADSPSTPGADSPSADFRLPPEGIPIPEEMAQVRDRLDTDKDGRLTEEELQAAPEAVQAQLREVFRKQSSPQPMPSPAQAEASPIPAEGVPIPEAMVRIKERFDTDKDNRLSPEEFEKIPESVRAQLLPALGGIPQPQISPATPPSSEAPPQAESSSPDD